MNPKWIPDPFYSEIKRVMPLPCVDLLVLYNGKLLLMKRRNQPGRGLWFTPGGRICKGESIEEAVKRVLNEETGLKSHDITQIGAMSHEWPTLQTITVFYKVEVETQTVHMNDEHSEYKWITESTSDLHPYVQYMINKSKIF